MTQTLALETVIIRTDNLMSTELDNDTVMMNIDSGSYYGLDGTGQRIWGLIETPRSITAVCEALLQEYDIDTETCRTQVLKFLNRLQTEGLVRVVDQALA
jgi:hypothetical protein